MLAFLGLSDIDELFDVVPEAIKLHRDLELADGVGEPDVLAHMEGYAERNRARTDRLVCFAGGGAYDHEIPSVTPALAGRAEFVTSYTPYQPEVAQGVLQADLRVPDHGGPYRRTARVQRLPLRRGECRGRGRQPGHGRHRPSGRLGVRGHPPSLARHARDVRGRDRPSDPYRAPGRRRNRLDRRAGRRRAARSGVGGLPELSRLPRGPGRRPRPVRSHRCPHGRGRRPAGRRTAAVGRRLGGRRDGGGGAGVRHPPRLRRPVPRTLRLQLVPREAAARAPGGRNGGRRGTGGLRHHPARPRTGHPSGKGHVQRMHQSDPHGRDGGRTAGLARHVGPGRSGHPVRPGHPLRPRRRPGRRRDHPLGLRPGGARVRRPVAPAGRRGDRAHGRRRASWRASRWKEPSPTATTGS